MPKLERWIVASRYVEVLDPELRQEIELMGGTIGGGLHQVHQHIHVNSDNKEAIEVLLLNKGYFVSPVGEYHIEHPVR